MKKIYFIAIISAFFASTKTMNGSDFKISHSSNKHFNGSKDYKNQSQGPKIEYLIGHLAIDLAWRRFCKSSCNKKMFKNTILPEGHNIFSPARDMGNVLDAPYIKTEKTYQSETEGMRKLSIKAVCKVRDEALCLSGKYFGQAQLAKSLSCLTFGTLVESEILQEQRINKFFTVQQAPIQSDILYNKHKELL